MVSPSASPASAASTLSWPGQSVLGVPVDDERVGQQAEAAEQQHLGQRLAERAAAGVLLGQAQRQHGRGGRGPAGSGQPPGQAAEREHRAPADHGRDEQGGVDAVQPDSRGEDERGPGHELGHDARAARVVVGAGEAQARVRAAERGRRVGNGQVAVVRDPVGDLEVGGGIAEVDDLLGTFGQLPDGEGYGDGDGGGQRPPVCCGRLAGGWLAVLGLAGLGLAGLAEGGPGGGELADGEVAQPGGQRGEHEHHRPGREAAGQQQREGRQQPGRGQQRGHHGDGAEQPPGPARVLLRRRRRCYGIVCLSDLSDPCGTWPMTHEPTIGPVPGCPAAAQGRAKPGGLGAYEFGGGASG